MTFRRGICFNFSMFCFSNLGCFWSGEPHNSFAFSFLMLVARWISPPSPFPSRRCSYLLSGKGLATSLCSQDSRLLFSKLCFHIKKETGRNLFSFLLPSQEQMASAQTRRNNARNWIPPYVSTIGIWTGFLGLLSKKLERQALFLSCWFGVFSIMVLTADSGLSPCVHALQCGAGPCPVPWSTQLCSAAAAAQSCPILDSHVTFLRSTQEGNSDVCLSL